MPTSPNDPAFPLIKNQEYTHGNFVLSGLTKREYFTAMFYSQMIYRVGVTDGLPEDYFSERAKLSLKATDALIAELNKVRSE